MIHPIAAIQQATAASTGFTVSMIIGRRRTLRLARARKHAMWRARQAGMSYPTIARWFGHRKHTTVMRALRKFDPTADTDAVDAFERAMKERAA